MNNVGVYQAEGCWGGLMNDTSEVHYGKCRIQEPDPQQGLQVLCGSAILKCSSVPLSMLN